MASMVSTPLVLLVLVALAGCLHAMVTEQPTGEPESTTIWGITPTPEAENTTAFPEVMFMIMTDEGVWGIDNSTDETTEHPTTTTTASTTTTSTNTIRIPSGSGGIKFSQFVEVAQDDNNNNVNQTVPEQLTNSTLLPETGSG